MGDLVGDGVGRRVGDLVGDLVGEGVGRRVGESVGLLLVASTDPSALAVASRSTKACAHDERSLRETIVTARCVV